MSFTVTYLFGTEIKSICLIFFFIIFFFSRCWWQEKEDFFFHKVLSIVRNFTSEPLFVVSDLSKRPTSYEAGGEG